MTYQLHYWDLPFRGIFPELVLVEAGADYERRPAGEIYPDHRLDRDAPGMAPPFLVEPETGFTLSQMPAIVMHLAAQYDLMPDSERSLSLALKLVLDANDVLDEITRHGGVEMWDDAGWATFRDERLAVWMQIFETVATRTEGAWLLGEFSVADLVALGLWGTMTHALPPLRADLERHAPTIAELIDHVAERPRIQAFLREQRERDGRAWCGGEIEASLKEVAGT